MIRKPMLLYYDNGQPERGKLLEKGIQHMNIQLIPIKPEHFRQTVGHLAKIKGFPKKPAAPFEVPPSITGELLVMCNFSEEKLDQFLYAMKAGQIPYISLKAVLTAQNCFWTFAQLFEELYEEHQNFCSE